MLIKRIIKSSPIYCNMCSNFFKRSLKRIWLNQTTYNLFVPQLFSTVVKNSFETGLTIYDSSVKQKVKLFTKLPRTVLWYCCGPTVYDSAHLGHARSYMQFDIMRRIMEHYFGLNVIMVMNITDIDDKIIAKCNELQKSYNAVSYFYEKQFFEDMALLNIAPPTIKARVTENIPDILEFIRGLVNDGFAYVSSDGSVYFNITKYSAYGKFSPTQEMYSNEYAKHRSEDFALWKSAKPREPFWDSPWGQGRPGWHIECSTIACKYLGLSIDIHSGGLDLKFPHHENEEAQCCARHGISQWVSYWIHTGHIFSKENEKMSKSLKNTVSVHDFLNDYTANVLRILCLMIPYRNDVELRKDTLDKAAAIDRKISHFLSDLESSISGEKKFFCDELQLFKVLHDTEQKMVESFSDDFDTNKALNELLHLISVTSSMLKSPSPQDSITNSPYSLAAVYNFIHSTFKNLGYNYVGKKELSSVGFDDLITSTVKFRSDIREAALAIKKSQPKELLEYKKHLLKACDSLRENYLKYGIELKDQGKTTTWSYTDRNIKPSIET